MGVPNSQKATRTWASALRKTLAILARQAGVPGMGRSPDEDGDGLILFSPSRLVYVLCCGSECISGGMMVTRCWKENSWLARVTFVYYDKPDPECDTGTDSRSPTTRKG